MTIELSPDELAKFDQVLANAQEIVSALVEFYINARQQHEEQGIGEALSIILLTHQVNHHFDAEELSSILVCAVVNLAASRA